MARPIRLSASLLSLSLVAIAWACGQSPDQGSSSGATPGADLYRRQVCVTCHGAAGEGTFTGPPLRSLRQHWTRQQLAAYLADPKARIKTDPRLQKLSRQFPREMPAVSLSEEERLAIADHVLGF